MEIQEAGALAWCGADGIRGEQMRRGWIVAFGIGLSMAAVDSRSQEASQGAAETAPAPEPAPDQAQADPGPEPAPPAPKPASPTRIVVEGGEAVEAGEAEMVQAVGEAPELRPQVVQLKRPPRDRLSRSADAGALRGLRVLGVQDGVARVVLADGGERTLRTGDTVAGDVVRSVSSSRILLDRRAAEGESGGSATVIVKVGAGGLGQVYVLWTRNPRPNRAPQVNR